MDAASIVAIVVALVALIGTVATAIIQARVARDAKRQDTKLNLDKLQSDLEERLWLQLKAALDEKDKKIAELSEHVRELGQRVRALEDENGRLMIENIQLRKELSERGGRMLW